MAFHKLFLFFSVADTNAVRLFRLRDVKSGIPRISSCFLMKSHINWCNHADDLSTWAYAGIKKIGVQVVAKKIKGKAFFLNM